MDRWIQITSGRGPEECCYAAGKVFIRFWGEIYAWGDIEYSLEHKEPSKHHGNYKSIVTKLSGKKDELDNFLKNWIGTIKWIEKSPYRKCGRKNWYVGVSEIVMPKISEISLEDIEIKAIRSSGKGGQNVNKVSSAVQITHLPSGLVIKAQEERSQKMNKRAALLRLKEVLRGKKDAENSVILFKNWMQHNILERGNEIKIFKH